MQSLKSNALEPTRSELATLSRGQAIVRLLPIYGLPILTVLLIAFFSFLLPASFPTAINARSILSDKGIIALLSLAAMVQCLQASLHGVLLDTLRIFARPREVPLPECNGSEESLAGEQVRGRELWEFIQRVFPDRRQRRVAYLLFHCHLKPQEIVRFCPDEFRDEEEIRRLRRSIFERLLPNTDPIQ